MLNKIFSYNKMNKTKVNNNNYAQNTYKSYNGNGIIPKKQYFINSNVNSFPRNYDAQYQTAKLLTGADTAGNVFINSGYNVRAESPGISWTL
jgi:hypothetical protein